MRVAALSVTIEVLRMSARVSRFEGIVEMAFMFETRMITKIVVQTFFRFFS